MYLFVYYKFLPLEYPDLEPNVRRLLDQVQAVMPDVKVQLLRRPDDNENGEQTWMETYACEPARLEGLQTTVAQIANALALPAPRRVEVFVAV